MLLFLLIWYTYCAMERHTAVTLPLLIASGVYQSLSKV